MPPGFLNYREALLREAVSQLEMEVARELQGLGSPTWRHRAPPSRSRQTEGHTGRDLLRL